MSDAAFELTAENWHHVQDLLAEALERPSAQRAAFLDAACAGTPGLRAEVESLLAAYLQADAFLDELDTAGVTALLADEVETGRAVGPYRLVRLLGRGGMGAVYLAERADGQFEQQVALKLIKRGMDSDAIVRRFLTERQILARLHHDHIARLFDGGLTDEGQPYFAMEYVEGEPITRYCDAHHLSIEARLALFQRVCGAVQYAHRNLIVHRDLKPSNILVTETGAVKLLDFGIARLLDDDSDASMTILTGFRAMTPEYAAPEQIQGAPVTTATDVYALGVILYELLTGHRPYQFERRGAAEIARVIAETTPAQPSMAISREAEILREDGTTETLTPEAVSRARSTQPDRLRRQLSGDLDTVVLKALHKEPERRYTSAEAFVDDVRRYLAGLPVQAQRDTLAYRATKFVRRHTVGVVAAVAFAVLLVGFAVTTALQQTRTARERDKAEEVKDFVLSLFEASNPVIEAKGDSIMARELLERGVNRIDAELEHQPEIQAEMLAVVGNVYKELGRYNRAEPLLARALALRREHVGPTHPDVAQSLHDLASVKQRQGNSDEAEALYREALALRRKRWGNEHLDVASTMNNLGVLLRQKGAYDEAEPFYREALRVQRKLLGNEHPQVLTTLNNLAVLLQAKGDYDEAEALHRDALAIRRRVLGDEHPHVALSLNNLGWVLWDKGDYAAAEVFYREALVMKRKLLGHEHPEVALSLNNVGTTLRQQGHFDEAEALFQEALALRRKLLGHEHPDVAATLTSLGISKRMQGRYDEAETFFRQSLEIYRHVVPEGHPRITLALVLLGHMLLEQSRPDEAEPMLREALLLYEQTLPKSHWQRAETQSLLGACLSALGRFEEAEPLLLDGYNRLKASSGREGETQRARQFLAAHYDRRGLPEQAASYRTP